MDSADTGTTPTEEPRRGLGERASADRHEAGAGNHGRESRHHRAGHLPGDAGGDKGRDDDRVGRLQHFRAVLDRIEKSELGAALPNMTFRMEAA